MTHQEAQLVNQNWKHVTFYVMSKQSGKAAIIGPGFHTLWLAYAWRKICRLWVADANFTCVASNTHT